MSTRRTRIVSLLAASLVLVACGRTAPKDKAGQQVSLAADGGAYECLRHADCDDESVCIEHECTYFGECLRDAHCGGGRQCVNNACTGEVGPPGEPMLCEINDDCPELTYCVDRACRRGTQCLRHAHCSLETACLGAACVELF